MQRKPIDLKTLKKIYQQIEMGAPYLDFFLKERYHKFWDNYNSEYRLRYLMILKKSA